MRVRTYAKRNHLTGIYRFDLDQHSLSAFAIVAISPELQPGTGQPQAFPRSVKDRTTPPATAKVVSQTKVTT